MKYNYRTLDYYQYWYTRLDKKKDFLKAYKDHVNSMRNGGRCMFACSFLCCCCCSTIGCNALTTCNFSKNWLDSINKTYDNLDEKKIKKIYKDALDILEKTRKLVYDKANFMKNKNYAEWINNYNESLYKIRDMYNDAWMHRIFYSLYNITSISIQIEYSLSPRDIDILFVAMPLFYPVMYKSEEYSYAMNQNIIEAIRRMIA